MDYGAARHDVGINIGGVGGFDDERRARAVKEVENVTQLVACPARDKDLVGRECDTTCVVVCGNRLAEEGRPTLGKIALKAILGRLVIHGLMQSLDDSIAQRKGHIANAHAQKMRVWVASLIVTHLLSDTCEEVRVLEFGIVTVGRDHRATSPS